MAGAHGAAQPRGHRAAAGGRRAATGASCAPCRTGRATTAATRWTAPSWPPSAGRPASPSTTACPRRSPGTATTRTGWRAPAAATGTATTSASTATASRPARRRRAAGPGGLTRCASPSSGPTGGSAARWSRRSRSAPFTGTRGPIGWDQPDLDLDTLTDGVGRGPPRRRPARGRHPHGRLDGRGRLRARARSRDAPQRHGRRRARPRLRQRAASTSCSSRPTRSSTDGGPTAAATPPTTSGTRSTRTAPRRPRASAWPIAAFEGDGCARPPRDRPDLLALRPARQRLPGQDRGRGAPCAGLREPLRVVGDEVGAPTYTPDLAEAIVELLAEDAITGGSGSLGDPPPRQRRPCVTRRLGPRGPACDAASTSRSRRSRAAPGSAPPRRRPGPCSSPRRCPRASRCATGARPSPTPSRLWCGRSTGADPTAPTPTDASPTRASTERATAALTIPPWRATARATRLERHSSVAGASPRRTAPAEPLRCASARRARRQRSSRASAPSPRPPHRPPAAATASSRSRSSSAPPTARRAKYRSYANEVYNEAIKYTSNVVQVYSPNATATKVQGRGQRRLDRRVPGPRQRLAQPVHVRPELHDQGRLRAQLRQQRRRQAHRLREQVLRRAVDPDAAPGAQRRRPAVPPVLRVGQPRVRGEGAEPRRTPSSASTTTRPRSSRPAPAPSSPTATATARTTSTRCSRRARRSTSTGATPRTATATSDVRVGAQPGLHVPAGPGERRPLLPVHRREDDAPDPGRHGCRLRGHLRGPADLVVPGNASPAVDGAPVYGSVASAQAGKAPTATLARTAKVRVDAREPADRVGRLPDLPGPHARRRGLDDRLVARPARQHRAAGLGGR